MKKHICDFCGNELVTKNKEENIDSIFSYLSSVVEVFKVRMIYKITRFSIQLPFGLSVNDLEVCSKCMTDFKEFVQRKQSYQGKDLR